MDLTKYFRKIRSVFLITVVHLILNVSSHNTGQILTPSNQAEAYFNSTSYLRLQPNISLKKQTGLSFRTCQGGILFSLQQNGDQIELSVSMSGVSFFVKISGKQYKEKISGNFIDNKWHTVYLLYSLGNLTLTVDGQTKLLANSSYQTDILSSSTMFSEAAAVLLVGKNFNGCLLEGPSLVFNSSQIMVNLNVVFGPCPIPYNDCTVHEPTIQQDFCVTEPCMGHGSCNNGPQTYTCSCFPRFFGKNCENDLGDPCRKQPPVCKNSGICTSDPNGNYNCTCSSAFTGQHCEFISEVDPLCTNNPCLNGGTCDVADNNVVCICPLGYTGLRCEINIDDCSKIPPPCYNDGICIDGTNNYTCNCTNTGYHGKNCELNINECQSDPCQNQGICFDNYGSYLCQCQPGYGGRNCELIVRECLSQPCLNRGTCDDSSGNFVCQCIPGFIGERCEIEQNKPQCEPDFCPSNSDCIVIGGTVTCVCKKEYGGDYPNCNVNPMCSNSLCKNGGICSISNGGHIICSCPPGFSGVRCEIAVTCSNKPCLHALTCTDFLGGYYCSCKQGWTGTNCDQMVFGVSGPYCQTNINECISQPCQNNGICIDQNNGYVCNCTDQFMGRNCEKLYDACELKPCDNNATCTTNLQNKHEYKCSCLSGFTGNNCEINIDDCVDAPCPSGTVCVDLVNDFECRCPPGYTGHSCTVDTNPCAKEPCFNGATCEVDEESFKAICRCADGYKGSLCTEDINECQELGDSICQHGICVNTNGSFQCYCKPGFTGERCNLDFNECLSMPCRNNATCLNKVNNYECICPKGFEGKECHINIDECDPMPCAEGATCIDGINAFSCACQSGLTGTLCDINIDDCSPNPCENDAECIDGLNNYICNCNDTGYEGNHCEINIDDCKGNPCQNGAQCIDLVKDYSCKCYPGYQGKNCEIDKNECDNNPCKHSGTCLERSNMTLYSPSIIATLNVTLPESFNRPFDYSDADGYECLCVAGVIGHDCEININECESSPCFQGSCVDKIGGYVCECDEGFDGIHCDNDIDECIKYAPCVHGTCNDLKANYHCECEHNYGGKNCSVELVACKNNPCLNEGLCIPYLVNENEHKFNCSCPNGFHGYICEKVTTMSLSGNSLITVNTTREEGYDIQFRFKTTLGDGLLALGKGLTYYILELSRGRLNLHSSLLNKWEGVFIGSNLNDSNWQKVFVAINSTHLVLSANDEQTIYPITFNENYNVSSTSFPLTYIGGFPSNLRKLTHGQPFLVGCTEDVLINGEWVLPEVRNSSWMNFQNIDVGCTRSPQCSPNPCYSGGHCTDRWRDFSCTCERPYLGHTCQYNYTAATFGYENITNSLVTVQVADYARRAVRTIVDISMFIRTRQSRGQIFYLGSPFGPTSIDETYIAAQLENGELLVRIQFNGSVEGYTVGGVKLDNGFNHLIEVIRNVTLVQVKLNNTEYFRKTISATGALDAQILYLGGQPQVRSVRQATEMSKMDMTPPTAPAPITSLSNINFKGIIQDVQISNGSSIMVVEFFPLQAPDLEIPSNFGEVSFDNDTILEGVHSDDSCRISPCTNGGTCANTWNDYRCICPLGYKGKECQDQEFCDLGVCPHGSTCRTIKSGFECISNSTFNGRRDPLRYNLMILPNSTRPPQFDTIEIDYRTRSWGTVFFAKHEANYFVVFIYHNEVVVEWNFNGRFDNRRFRKDRFEGQWLRLHFIYRDNQFLGGFKENVMDEAPEIRVQDFNFETLEQIFQNGIIYIAGSDNEQTFDFKRVIDNTDFNMTGYIPVSESTTAASLLSNSLEEDGVVYLYKVDQNKETDRFKGCLGEIRIGGLLLPFVPGNHSDIKKEFYELLPDSKPEIGCILCYNEDCYNQGYCISPPETYKCNCTEGYTADDCSIDINECETVQCQNNATCIDLIAKFKCECVMGFEGDLCEIDINECLSNPCRHGGTCIDLIGAYKCDCPQDFVGKQCEAPLLITCENQPCTGGSTCKNERNEQTGNNFTCYCTEGMEGVLCDIPFCKKKHCEHGFCNTSNTIPYCQCQHGFEGKFCEIDIDECILPTGKSPCQNGGICRDGIFRYDCICEGTGFTGILCENDIDECNLTTHENPCGENGVCENLPGTYRCTCDIPGKCGHHCTLDDLCITVKPCKHGICESLCTEHSNYTCKCRDGYTGQNCSELKVAASRADGGVNILYIVIPIIFAILIGLGVGLIVLVNVARSKRATRGTYSPSAQEFCNPRVELDHVLKPPPEERLI